MFTQILPAGDLFPYAQGMVTSRGEPREQPPERLRGDERVATALLVAQAPKDVRSKKLPPHQRPTRSSAPWVRHCQAHLVHFINCFHESETQSQVERHLPRIIRATEDLVLAGLPREALHFTWFKHGQAQATHSHGGMLCTLLLSGAPYQPRLDSKLQLHFDRLVSRRLGYTDPLDPSAFRIVHAAWGSWKPENYATIRQVCEATTQAWRDGKLEEHKDFLKVLQRPEFGLTLVDSSDETGQSRPRRHTRDGGPAIHYAQTVAVLADEGRRVIYFKGPVCRPAFRPERWRRQVDLREQDATELREHPERVFARFARLLQQRLKAQRPSWHGPDAERVSAADFQWLNKDSQEWQEPSPAPRALTADELFSPDMNWGDRDYPFVSDVPPKVSDLADPELSPLRESIGHEMLHWEHEERTHRADAEVGPAPILAPPIQPPPVRGAPSREPLTADRKRRRKLQLKICHELALEREQDRMRPAAENKNRPPIGSAAKLRPPQSQPPAPPRRGPLEIT